MHIRRNQNEKAQIQTPVLDDRLKIETMLKDKRHKQEIADEIGVHLKTIYNEIKRGRYIHTNSDLTEEERYSPEMAEAAYREHLAAKGPDLKIGNDHELAQHIEKENRRRRLFAGRCPGRN